MLTGKKPNLARLQEWGTKVWVHDKSGSKLDGRSRIGRWVGFEEASDAHRIYWSEKRSVTVERSIKFDENDVLVPSGVPIEGENVNGNQEHLQQTTLSETSNTLNQNSDIPVEDPPTSDHSQNIPASNHDHLGPNFEQEPVDSTEERTKRIRKESAYVRRLREGVEGSTEGRPKAPQLPKGIQSIPEASTESGALVDDEKAIPAVGIEYAMATAVAESEAMDPQSLEEARRRKDWPRWEEAIKVELEVLKKAGTWGVVERPKGRNIVACKWVFRIKKDAAGQIERYKARLVAKGFTQVFGVDYYETFAPVAKLASIRTILAIAARNGWQIDMFDFHSAFLNGKLDGDEEVFMEQPPDYEDSDRTKYCLKLYKSIYGLKQAGRKWYEVVCRTLADLGLKRSEADQAVFYAHIGKEIIILAIHVDDCTITGSSYSLIQKYKAKINSKYSMTDLGPVNWLLGIKVTRDLETRTISLSQTSYIDSILQRFNFTDVKPYATPMDPNIQLSKSQSPKTLEEAAKMRRVPYREAVGSLMYCAVATRPDIAFAVGIVSQYLDNPGWAHWEAVKRIFRYLAGTRDWSLIHGRDFKGAGGIY